MKRTCLHLIWVGIGFLAAGLAADTAVNVPLHDPVYRAIDRLNAAGLIRSAMMGQRPYTRGEVARLLDEARENFEPALRVDQKISLNPVLKFYERKFAAELACRDDPSSGSAVQLHPLDRVRMDFNFSGADPRQIYDNGVGQIDARLDPLFNYNEGRLVKKGFTWGIESGHWLASRYLAMEAVPRVQMQSSREDSEAVGVYVHRAYGKAGYKNIELEVGRDHLVWGQGKYGGLLFTTHARGLDMAKLSTPQPFRIPWIGLGKATLAAATMGPNYHRQKAVLTAMKFSLQPAKWMEVGGAYAVIMGGEGGPKMGAGDVAQEMFGFVPGVGKTSNTFSNKIGGLDFRLRVPPFSGLQVYGELGFDDKNFDNPNVFFTDAMGVLAGAYFPGIGRFDHVSARFEYRHLPAIFYRHTQLLSGYTLSGYALGDPLGPDSKSFTSELEYSLSPETDIGSGFAYEIHEGNSYAARTDGDIFITAAKVPEKRHRFSLNFGQRLTHLLRADVSAAYERISHFNFASGMRKHNYKIMVGLQMDLDRVNEGGGRHE